MLLLFTLCPAVAEEERPKAYQPEGYTDIVPPEHEPVGDSYFSDAVFVGDSMTSSLESLNLFPEAEFIFNIGMSIASAKRNQFRLPGVSGKVSAFEAAAHYEPAKVFIFLGSNTLDVVKSTPALNDYQAMLDQMIAALPNAVIYAISPPPMTPARFKKEVKSGANPARYRLFEEGLRAICEERGVYYIDLYHMVTDENGYMKRACAAGDGYHLNADTSAALADYIKRHAVPYGNE